MTTTTAARQYQCVLNIDDVSATLADVSGSTTTVAFAAERDQAFVWVLDGKISVSDSNSAETVEVEVVWSTTSTDARALIEEWHLNTASTARTVQIDIPDSSTGSRRYTGEYTLGPYSWAVDASGRSDLIRANFTLSANASITMTDIA